MKRFVTPALLALLALGACETPAGPPREAPPVDPPPATGGRDLSWLRASAVPLRTVEPGGPYDDLMPLKEIIGDARIVALGEGTHGTREFFQAKHRLLEFLVKEMGFDTFAMEVTWAESYRVDDYVRTGAGDPRVALSNLYFWIYNTEEVLGMIEWMRRHNEDPGGAPRVGFFGFDMQYPRVAMDDVERFVRRVDPASAGEVAALYGCFRRHQDDLGRYPPEYLDAPVGERAACHEGVVAVHDLLSGRGAAYAAASSEAEFARALRAARIVVQNEQMRGSAIEGGLRDRFMAENAAWLLEQAGPDAKIVLWAHNGHVDNGRTNLGGILRRDFGDEFLNVGFGFYEGSFNARELSGGNVGDPRAHRARPARPGSYEWEFHRLGEPYFLLDLREAPTADPATDWIQGPLRFRSIGAAYDPLNNFGYAYDARLPRTFDLVFFAAETTESRLLPFRYR